MATYMFLESACGREQIQVKYIDFDSYPHGTICCQECQSIVISREAWGWK